MIIKSLVSNRLPKKPLSNLTIHFEQDSDSTGSSNDQHVWLEQWSVPLIWPGNQFAFSVQRSNRTIGIGLMGSCLTMDQLQAIENGLMFSLHELERQAHRISSTTMTKLLSPVSDWGKLDKSLHEIEKLIGQSTEVS